MLSFVKISFNPKYQLIMLVMFAIGLNINTLFNEYALDDLIVLTGNQLVEQGIKGIPQICTSDFFYGMTGEESGLSGGRYRPVPLIIFAMEHQFFGNTPFVSHAINLLLFIILIFLLFNLLHNHIFKEQASYFVFITCLIFVVHPIHTEVIANVKSRDELITFILLLLTSFAFIKYFQKRSVWIMFAGLLSYFLALLTRESAIPFILIVPLVAYFFFNLSVKRALLLSIPLLIVFAIYMLIRIAVVGFHLETDANILDMPFMYASQTQAFATKTLLILKYLILLFFPHPLSSDYSYNQIPYINLGSFQFIFSGLIILVLLIYSLITFSKKSIYSFSILYFFVSIFLFSNFIMNIGAPLADRLLFQPSLAFCLVVAAINIQLEKNYKFLSIAGIAIIVLLFSIKTIARNADWKNNETLFFSDVKNAPNSLKTNIHAAKYYILKAKTENNKELKKEYFRKAILYDEKARTIDSSDRYIYLGLGTAYFGLDEYFKAADNWLYAYKLDSSHEDEKARLDELSNFLLDKGINSWQLGNVDLAIKHFKKAIELNQINIEAWYNLGGMYFKINDTKHGIEAWQIVQRLAPAHPFNKNQFTQN